MHRHLEGLEVPKERRLSVLAVGPGNIDALSPVIQRNVLGLQAPVPQGD